MAQYDTAQAWSKSVSWDAPQMQSLRGISDSRRGDETHLDQLL